MDAVLADFDEWKDLPRRHGCLRRLLDALDACGGGALSGRRRSR